MIQTCSTFISFCVDLFYTFFMLFFSILQKSAKVHNHLTLYWCINPTNLQSTLIYTLGVILILYIHKGQYQQKLLTVYNSKLPGFDDSFVLVSWGYTADVGSREVPTVFEIPLLASFIVPICTILNIDKNTFINICWSVNLLMIKKINTQYFVICSL